MSLVEGRRQGPRKIQYRSNQGRKMLSKRMGGQRDQRQWSGLPSYFFFGGGKLTLFLLSENVG